MEVIEQLNPEKLVYVDESGVDAYVSREYAWSERGLPVIGERAGKRFARESFVAGLMNKNIVAPFCYQGTMDNLLFNFWLSNFLLPQIGSGHIVIMDNAAFHKSQKTLELIKAAGCEVTFLPPYSPDLNPIEKFWANLKKKIKNSIANFDSLALAIDQAFKGSFKF
ncbi:IS630 family transposase [Legionella pneumophila]|uniref:IS630 family transposase n=1 Tax=Legionella pneumophila TaxID=446 RepID=UPI001F005C09|nr:IS630 family transposase [Legionella pneumophila]